MTQFCPKMVQFSLKRRIQRRVSILRRCILRLLDQLLICPLGKPSHYRMLPTSASSTSPLPPHPGFSFGGDKSLYHNHEVDGNSLVPLKITLLGDCHIGKTCFLEKYVGDARQHEGIQGLNMKDKTLALRDANISYCIWEVEGNMSDCHIEIACRDSVAILIMFDLTSRCTLNSVIGWYQQARKWNQTAIPILVGTKFDEFIQLPIDLQWTIASQARAYAKALNGTLFFSSATYNINVNKIFKFITAKLFDLPWTVERNLNVGEPIIDF